ncbi:MAG: hypothetical protein HMLKMBBP_01052 [Planctomycetes bacterium]|nr:hypothetical protein [Planctomycetota bacterium]
MPRIKEDSSTLMADLVARLDRLVRAAVKEGREQALAEVRALVAGGAPVRRGPGRPRKSDAAAAVAGKAPKARRKSSKPRKNWWNTATEAEKAARVKKMLAGRGLEPKSK